MVSLLVTLPGPVCDSREATTLTTDRNSTAVLFACLKFSRKNIHIQVLKHFIQSHCLQQTAWFDPKHSWSECLGWWWRSFCFTFCDSSGASLSMYNSFSSPRVAHCQPQLLIVTTQGTFGITRKDQNQLVVSHANYSGYLYNFKKWSESQWLLLIMSMWFIFFLTFYSEILAESNKTGGELR